MIGERDESIHILHVDDDPNSAELTAELLEQQADHIIVETASSASEGLETLATTDIDCIVSDYEMPGMDGIEFLDAVRDEYPDISFFLFTGKGSEEIASEAISAGVTDYLQKQGGTEQYTVLANRIEHAVEKYRTERDLAATRRQYKKLVEQNFVGIYIIRNGEFVYVNPKLAEIHGYDRETIIGMSPLELVAPEERDRVKENLNQRLEGEVETIQYQTVGLTKEGEHIDIELYGSRIQHEGAPAVIGSELDITERKDHERELERQNKRLEEFTSVVSHDLRNPLNVAELRLDLARDECESDHLDDAATAVDRSLTLIDTLLTLARDGEEVSEFDPVELDTTIEDCWQTVETNHATLVTETARTIHADTTRLKQLLENLLRNAVEHGSDDVTITIGDLADGFYVADDGPGIPDDEHEQVFEPGYSTVDEGTGFGLNIVEDIAEAHGWQIRITESKHGGARFEITGIETVE